MESKKEGEKPPFTFGSSNASSFGSSESTSTSGFGGFGGFGGSSIFGQPSTTSTGSSLFGAPPSSATSSTGGFSFLSGNPSSSSSTANFPGGFGVKEQKKDAGFSGFTFGSSAPSFGSSLFSSDKKEGDSTFGAPAGLFGSAEKQSESKKDVTGGSGLFGLGGIATSANNTAQKKDTNVTSDGGGIFGTVASASPFSFAPGNPSSNVAPSNTLAFGSDKTTKSNAFTDTAPLTSSNIFSTAAQTSTTKEPAFSTFQQPKQTPFGDDRTKGPFAPIVDKSTKTTDDIQHKNEQQNIANTSINRTIPTKGKVVYPFSWGCGQSISICGEDNIIYNRKFIWTLPEVDALIAESFDVFDEFQKDLNTNMMEDFGVSISAKLLNVSRLYQAVVLKHIKALEKGQEGIYDMISKEEARKKKDRSYPTNEIMANYERLTGKKPTGFDLEELYRNNRCKWAEIYALLHLIEIIFCPPIKCIGSHIAKWVLQHFPRVRSQDEEKSIWWHITNALMKADFETAKNMLSRLVNDDRSANIPPKKQEKILLQYLERMPDFREMGDDYFVHKWKTWQEGLSAIEGAEGRKRLAEHLDALEEALDHMDSTTPNPSSQCSISCALSLLSGDDRSLVCHSENWMELLGAFVVYKDPTVPSNKLANLTTAAISHFSLSSPSSLPDNEFDGVLLAAMMSEPYELMLRISRYFDESSQWVAAHVVDLLYHYEAFPPVDFFENESSSRNEIENYRELIIVNYANQLFTETSQWKKSLCYLSHCPQYGLSIAKEIIHRIPVEDIETALKLRYFCANWKNGELQTEINCILRVLARNLIRRDKLIEAAHIYDILGDKSCLRTITLSLVDRAVKSGSITELDSIVGNIENITNLKNPRTKFLTTYRRLREAWASREWATVAQLTTDLIKDDTTPHHLWLPLMIQAIPLLESKSVYFSRNETFRMMQRLQDVLLSKKVEKQMNDDIQALRLALTRNLSKAIVLCK